MALTTGEVPNKENSCSLFPRFEKWTTLLQFLITILIPKDPRRKIYIGPPLSDTEAIAQY